MSRKVINNVIASQKKEISVENVSIDNNSIPNITTQSFLGIFSISTEIIAAIESNATKIIVNRFEVVWSNNSSYTANNLTLYKVNTDDIIVFLAIHKEPKENPADENIDVINIAIDKDYQYMLIGKYSY